MKEKDLQLIRAQIEVAESLIKDLENINLFKVALYYKEELKELKSIEKRLTKKENMI